MEFESIHSMISQLKFIFNSTTSFPNLNLHISLNNSILITNLLILTDAYSRPDTKCPQEWVQFLVSKQKWDIIRTHICIFYIMFRNFHSIISFFCCIFSMIQLYEKATLYIIYCTFTPLEVYRKTHHSLFFDSLKNAYQKSPNLQDQAPSH